MQPRNFFFLALGTTALSVLTLLGCGGGKKSTTTPTPTPAPTPTPGPGTPTFTRVLLNGTFGESGIASGGEGIAVGSARAAAATAGSRQAVIWSVPGASPANLHPASRSSSELFGSSSALFAGWTTDSGGISRATLWDRGASNTAKEIAGSFTESRAYGTSGNLIVGQGRPSGATLHAIVWNHSASDTPTDLNGSFTSSSAYGLSGARVVGFGAVGGADHAIVWNTAAGNAVTDLHPAGATSSTARGISGDIVVGAAGGRAGFWNLAAGNAFTELTPGVAGTAFATNGRFVVGVRGVGSFTTLTREIGTTGAHATLWDRESANAAIDLHTIYLADQGFDWSAALGVDAAGNVYGVGGAVIDDFNANYRAWVLIKN